MRNGERPNIKQIIPAPDNMYAVFEIENEKGEKEMMYSRIVCLALADDGEVYSMDSDTEGIIDYVEFTSNYLGIKWGARNGI
jgi:hypothetical protein